MNLKKGDTVKIIAGKEKNKTGKILKVFPEKSRVLVEGLNLYKKHVRPKTQNEKGQTISVPRSISASNAMILCSGCGKAVRVAYKIEEGKKSRYCRKCGTRLS